MVFTSDASTRAHRHTQAQLVICTCVCRCAYACVASENKALPRALASIFIMKDSAVVCLLVLLVLTTVSQGCSNNKRYCEYWSRRGYCTKEEFESYMKKHCKESCKLCGVGGGSGDGDGGSTGGSGQCGFKPSARSIVGGAQAPKGGWPWQAMVRTTSGFAYCGGTLVHPQWVVTAAHCVYRRSASSIRVRLGAYYRSKTVGTEQDLEVEKIINHHSYKSPYGMAHDISLLRLSRPAQINKAVGLACLPPSNGSVQEGKDCWVTGFGTPSVNFPDVLMQVSIPIVDQAKCIKTYGSKLIHDSMVCAGHKYGGKGPCQGDSGGPMVCEMGGKFFLEGVVSWSMGCAAPGKYGVYARVRYLRQWVKNTMSKY